MYKFGSVKKSVGGQNLERPIFRKFETSNIKITKVELFDFSISELCFIFLIV